jgi:hypothetical protein
MAVGTVGSVRGGPILVLALLVASAQVAEAADAASTVLASYGFDEDAPAGPDTFRIFQYSKGTVRLTSAYHVSGTRAIELRDVAGDKSMPEIQGYFPVQSDGRLDAHFSFLSATPQEELNVALAGPQRFRLEKDGIAFWLKSERGMLVHYSGRVPKALLRIEPFVWYTVDVAYDLGAGAYDLTIRQEGRGDPLVRLLRQKNACGVRGSAVDKFSFVGQPFGDTSNVVYYVDDIVVRTNASVAQRPFVAPGRRKLFVEAFTEYRARQSARPRCLPGAGPEDFGFDSQNLAEAAQTGILDGLATLASARALGTSGLELIERGPRSAGVAPRAATESPDAAGLSGATQRKLEAALDWSRGCAALERDEPQAALARFDTAAASVPEARIYGLSQALALIALGRAAQADERLALEGSAWGSDARYAVALALAGTARDDLERAEAWLRAPAEAALARGGSPILRRLREHELSSETLDELKRSEPRDWQAYLSDAQVSEQYFYVLLWRSQPQTAREYALRMAERFALLGLASVGWVERGGDAAFYSQDVPAAKASYEEALRLDAAERTHYWALVLKLCDIAFLTGDHATERSLREQYYGALREP